MEKVKEFIAKEQSSVETKIEKVEVEKKEIESTFKKEVGEIISTSLKNENIEQVKLILETHFADEQKQTILELKNLIVEEIKTQEVEKVKAEDVKAEEVKAEEVKEIEIQKKNKKNDKSVNEIKFKEKKIDDAFDKIFPENQYENWYTNLISAHDVEIFDDYSFKDFLASKLTLLMKSNDELDLTFLIEKLKNNPNYFKNLQVEGCFNNEITAFVFLILKKLFGNINQQAIYSQSFIKPLLPHYSHRLTIGNLNNNLLILYFKSKNIIPMSSMKGKHIEQILNKIFNNQAFSFKVLFSTKEVISSQEVLSIYCQTNIKPDIAINFITNSEAEFLEAEFLEYKTFHRFDKLLFNEGLMSVKGNKDYIIQNYGPESRGNMIYYFPNGYKRFGLFVGEGVWLSMSNQPGEWSVAYTSVKDTALCPDLAGKLNININSKGKYPTISKDGIQVAVNVKTLEPFLDSIEIFGRKYIVAFQCRINPDLIQISQENSEIYVLDRTQSDCIRPYGILITEKN